MEQFLIMGNNTLRDLSKNVGKSNIYNDEVDYLTLKKIGQWLNLANRTLSDKQYLN